MEYMYCFRAFDAQYFDHLGTTLPIRHCFCQREPFMSSQIIEFLTLLLRIVSEDKIDKRI